MQVWQLFRPLLTGGGYTQLGTMKKLIILAFLAIPVLVSAYRQEEPADFSKKLIQAAIERTKHIVRYDGSYRKISYPNGDVPGNVGVCTDVVIRSYRILGIDLQKDIHEDMKENFDKYPKLWGLSKPDTTPPGEPCMPPPVRSTPIPSLWKKSKSPQPQPSTTNPLPKKSTALPN